MSRQKHDSRACSLQRANKHVTASITRHQVHLETLTVGHSLPVLRRLQTCFVTALSSSITAQRSKTTAQVNIALTKFETALQVSVLIWVLLLWDGVVKRLQVKSKETVGNSWTVLSYFGSQISSQSLNEVHIYQLQPKSATKRSSFFSHIFLSLIISSSRLVALWRLT